MSETIHYTRSPGIRVTAGGQRVGGVIGVECPPLGVDALETTALNAGWRALRPIRRCAGDLKLTLLLKSADAGQAALLGAYLNGEALALGLVLPGGQSLTWSGYVRSLALKASRPNAPAVLEAAVFAAGEAGVSA